MFFVSRSAANARPDDEDRRDPNVIVSALIFGGLPQQILDLTAQDACQLCFSAAIQNEVERVLEEKFGWNREQIHTRVARVFSWGIRVSPTVRLTVIKEDPDDDRILECAVAAQAAVIISGDQDLIKLGSFEGIKIATPRQFIEYLRRPDK